jgi:DNA polymerase-3 subunit beta
VDREALVKGLALTARATPGRTVMPVLQHVLLEAGEGLALTGTDLTTTIHLRLPATVEGTGAVTVPAATFRDWVRNVHGESIQLELAAETPTLTVTCGRFKSNWKGLAAAEFPVLPDVGTMKVWGQAPVAALQDAVERVAPAIARRDGRPVLEAMALTLRPGEVVLVGADGFRLSWARLDWQVADFATSSEAASDAETTLLVPRESVQDLGQMFADKDARVTIGVIGDGRQVVFQSGEDWLVAQLVDGRYPDIEQIIPTTARTKVIVPQPDLAHAVRLARAFSSYDRMAVCLRFGATGGEVFTRGTEVGHMDGRVEAQVEGEPVTVGFNPDYLLDALAGCSGEVVEAWFSGSGNPALFKEVSEAKFQAVVMPVVLTDLIEPGDREGEAEAAEPAKAAAA